MARSSCPSARAFKQRVTAASVRCLSKRERGRVRALKRKSGAKWTEKDCELATKVLAGLDDGSLCVPKMTSTKGLRGRTEVEEYGVRFRTGEPVTLRYVRNTKSAPDFGARFQQDIEPAGRYLLHNPEPGDLAPGWEKGEVRFRNPLVIEFNEGDGTYDERSWKAWLSKQYGGKKGKALSRAICAAGHDGIVTVSEYRGTKDTREIVDLTWCVAAKETGVEGLGRTKAKVRPLVSDETAVERIVDRHPDANLTKLPKHIEPFGRYMTLVAAEPVTARRVVKAYVITRSSVQRAGMNKAKLLERYATYEPVKRSADPAMVRPEDVMSQLLFTPEGERYLDAAEKGKFDKAAAKVLVDKMSGWGFDKTLMADLKRAVRLGKEHEKVAEALAAPADQYWSFIEQNVKGIGASKAGFLAALLGRGDIPTFDAREKALWLRYGIKPGKRWNPSWSDVKKLKRRLETFPMAIPEGLEPFKVHLVHHALWDAYASGDRPSKTTHGALIRSMQFAGLGDLPKAFVARPPGWKAAGDEAHALFEAEKGSLWRGMTEDEYAATVGAGAPIRSTGAYSFESEGTNFSEHAGDAESYVNYGQDDPRATGRSTYLVEVDPSAAERASDGYFKASGPVPLDKVRGVWKMDAKDDAVVATRVRGLHGAALGNLRDFKWGSVRVTSEEG